LRYGVLAAFENDSEFAGSQALDDGSVATVNVQQSGRDFGVVRLLYENTQTGRKSIGMISTLVAHEDSEASTHGIDCRLWPFDVSDFGTEDWSALWSFLAGTD